MGVDLLGAAPMLPRFTVGNQFVEGFIAKRLNVWVNLADYSYYANIAGLMRGLSRCDEPTEKRLPPDIRCYAREYDT